MKSSLLHIVSAGFLALALSGEAATVATAPAGYTRLTAGAGRDTWLSLPLVRRSELIARISAVSPATLSLDGVTMTADAYAPSAGGAYYAQFTSGNLAGRCYRIVGNTTGTVTLATESEDLSAHILGAIATGATGDLIRIRPYWTVADVFGPGVGSPLLAPVAAVPAVIYSDGDALLLPDNAALGAEKAPAAVIAYVTGQGWRRQGQPATDSAAVELPPGVPFVVRRSGAAVSTLLVGYVSQDPGLIRLPALPAGGEIDVAAALFHPWVVTLADSGLAGMIESSVDADHARDLLLSPSDTRGGFSLPPARRLHLVGSSWFEGTTAADGQTLRTGAGFLIRLRGERPVRYWRQAAPN